MAQTIIGKIASVSLQNFITYDTVVFYPEEYLNVILGPNGTGKSAIVAGIVLGMGGHCKLLSRCDNLESYIKFGKDSATIRISLYENKKRKLRWFCRMFDNNKKDVFEIDSVKVSHRAFLEQVRSFNIQVDNLCQFLPQDRVQDFTKMNPRELLLSTQSSVCTPEMNEWFTELKVKQSDKQRSSNQRKTDANRIRELEARITDLEQQLESDRTRQEFEKQIKVCEARKAWLEYEEQFHLYTTTVQDQKLATRSFKEKEKEYKACKAEVADVLAKKTDLQKAQTDQVSEAKRSTNEINKLEEKTESLEDALRQQTREMQDTLAKAVERQSELDEAKLLLSAVVQDCADAAKALGSEEEVREQVAKLCATEAKVRNESDLLMGRRNELNQKIDTDLKPEMMSIQRSIESIENVANNRLKVLQARFAGTYRAVMWLRENGHLFQGKIYEPMILELNVPVPEHVQFLENTIGVRDLIAFTCEKTEDMNQFLRLVREEMRIEGVNAIHSGPADRLNYKAKNPIASLKRFGFHSYLIDMIEGPFPVLNGLCKLYGLHNIPVGSQESAKYVTSLPEEIAVFFTPTNRFQVSKSRYTGEKSTRSDVLRTHNLLNQATNQKLLDERRQQHQQLVRECDRIRNLRGEIENQIKQLQERCTELSSEKRVRQETLGKYQQTKLKVSRQQAKCKDLSKRLINEDEVRDKYQQSCRTIMVQIVQYQRAKVAALFQHAGAIAQQEVLGERLRIFEESHAASEGKFRSVEEAFQTAKRTLANVQRKLEDTKEKASKKNVRARSLTAGKAPDKADFPYREQFAALPDELAALATHLDELNVRFDCIPSVSKDTADEYAHKKRQLDQLRTGVSRSEKDAATLEREMSSLHNRWYPEICRVVQQINVQFSHFMSRMGFAGEVQLSRDDEYNYDEYGIRIFVKYRNKEKLCALDRKLQSGGERAVAIAIYTLALQNMTQVPFRCVDEINQGMDPTNERKVFDMLVEETCREGQSQYFFVTPKLLPRLTYNDKTNVILVHNGQYIESPDVFLNAQK
ncbi:structural maintenance of chromosomes protein 5 [Anopheles bellator]|uniref:structural maintenance of chromosomes protein 5 n=1 Tax=Anopheles bellator TaxID=139047 RepID=UPI0026497705|nr:structural maintenance of chromosomes protein 5 [Anopheles bellator]